MLSEKEFSELCRISGFTVGDKKKFISDMEEIIGIMDSINSFEPTTEISAPPKNLSELRDDVPLQQNATEIGCITIKRMVQSDD